MIKTELLPALMNGGLMTADQILLLRQAVFILNREKIIGKTPEIVDYGFIVFTAAKAYEGFLKTFFYQLGLISKGHFSDEHFRIGKALNPDLPTKYRNSSWIYDDLALTCGQQTAQTLWQAWKSGRNEIFHYFADSGNIITIAQADSIMTQMIEAMWIASMCEVKTKR